MRIAYMLLKGRSRLTKQNETRVTIRAHDMPVAKAAKIEN